MENGFKLGLKNSLSIAIGYAPVAVTFGILAARYGISPFESGLMSLLVFAGASQFIAIEMIYQGSSLFMITLTTLIVNIRHVLMGLSLIPLFPKLDFKWSLGLAQGITDETFVLNSRLLRTFADESQRRGVMLGVNIGAFSSWVVFTLIGGWLGEKLPLNFSGFEFALLALFIFLASATLNKRNLLTFILAGIFAILFRVILPGKIYLILSVIVAAGIGAYLKQFRYTQRSEQPL